MYYILRSIAAARFRFFGINSLRMADFELHSFIRKFRHLSNAGYKASLQFTSKHGCICVTLNVDLSLVPLPPYQFSSQNNQPCQRVKRSPAYFRRQTRRKGHLKPPDEKKNILFNTLSNHEITHYEAGSLEQKVVEQKSRNEKLDDDNDAVESKRNSKCQDENEEVLAAVSDKSDVTEANNE